MSDTSFAASAVLAFAAAAMTLGGPLASDTRAEPGQIFLGQTRLEPELAAPGARGEGLDAAPDDTAAPQQARPFTVSTEPVAGVSDEPAQVRTVARSKPKRPQIEVEDTWVGNLHRMQVPFPEHNVVVCLAGCQRGRESIVFFQKRQRFVTRRSDVYLGAMTNASGPLVRVASNEAAEPASSTTAPDGATEAAPAEAPIACVAGCYGSKKAYNGRRSVDVADPGTGRVQDGVWLTGVGGSTSAPVMTRYSRSRGVRKDTSSEWFTKRF